MLFRIDPATGQPTEVGKFKGARSVMDFAINPKDGGMYATTTTALYRLRPKTAEMTQVAWSRRDVCWNSADRPPDRVRVSLQAASAMA
jgi:hypothetical protein